MPTPSLLIVPARFKTGRLYSQIPVPVAPSTSSVGDFNVTRATVATRVNASGLIESVASGIPRLDYFASGGVVGCPALLVEPSGKNEVLQSTFSTGWLTAAGGSVSGNASGTNSPDGTTNAALFNVSTSTFSAIYRAITTVSGSVYTASVFAKKRDKNFLYFVNLAGNTAIAWFNLASGTVGTVGANTTARIENYGNGWYRCSITQTVASTTSYIQLGLSDADNTNAAASSGSNFVFGAQFELSSVATSYIPTTTAAVTRNADVISVSGAVSGSIGQTEGTMYWEGSINRYDRVFFALSSGTSTTQAVRLQTTGGGLFQAISISGTAQCNIQASGVVTLGEYYKIAFAYKENDFALYINGTLRGTDTSGTLPPNLNSVYLCNSNGTEITDQRCRAAALYTTRLTNEQLQALTT